MSTARLAVPAALAAALVVTITGCGTTTTVTTSRPSASPKVTASTAAQTPEQKLLAWKNGPGWSAFTTLDRQLTTTANALKKDGATPAAAAQCTNLSGDAQAAEPFPPPVATSDYMKAVKAYASAGTLCATGVENGDSGDFAAAATDMDAANIYLDKVVAAFKALTP